MQPHLVEDATPCNGAYSPVWWRLQPHLVEAATLCDCRATARSGVRPSTWPRCWTSTRGSWGGRTHSRSPSLGWHPASTRRTAWLPFSARWKIACISSRRHASTARRVVPAASERPTHGPRRPLTCTRLHPTHTPGLQGRASAAWAGLAVQPCSLSEPPAPRR